MLYILLLVYSTVLVTELLGDKTLYIICSLTARFRSLAVLCGVILAFMAKMLAAVLIYQFIKGLPTNMLAAISAATFFITAALLWRRKSSDSAIAVDQWQYPARAVVISFAAIFFSEWGDIGQLTAGSLAAKYQAPVLVWFGATLALVTKSIFAATLGVKLKERISGAGLRVAAIGLCLILGLTSVIGLMRN